MSICTICCKAFDHELIHKYPNCKRYECAACATNAHDKKLYCSNCVKNADKNWARKWLMILNPSNFFPMG